MTRNAKRNTSLPWSRRLVSSLVVLPEKAMRLGGRTLGLHLVWAVPCRLLIPTPLTLETPFPIAPTVPIRLIARTRTAMASLVLSLKTLNSSPLDSLDVTTRKQDVVFYARFMWNEWSRWKLKSLGMTKLPAFTFARVTLVYPKWNGLWSLGRSRLRSRVRCLCLLRGRSRIFSCPKPLTMLVLICLRWGWVVVIPLVGT